MDEFGKVYLVGAFVSMFLIPVVRSTVFGAEIDGMLETVAAFICPIGIPLVFLGDYLEMKRKGERRPRAR